MKKHIQFLFMLLPLFASAQVQPSNQVQGLSKNESVQKYDEILSYINLLYVDDVENKKLFEAAIEGLLEKLDPHSSYIPKEESQSANDKINGNFVGIGVRFQMLKDTFNIVQVIPGGPSEKVGLMDGDKIISVDGENVAGTGIKNSDIRKKLMGELNTKVKVEIMRPSAKKILKFTITRGKIPMNSVDAAFMIDHSIGYIKLNSFSKTTTQEVDSSIRLLSKQGMKSLILDLQDNGGGLMYAAKDIADMFLSDNKLIVYSEGRKQPKQELVADKKGIWEKGSLILLTNENSASASEIVSGAIQDWDRGLIIGRRSFGKGLVQRPIRLADGGELRLTIARYFTPTGRWIQRPYADGVKAYKSDYLTRYLHGEMIHKDSIKFPDSLKYQTNITKRTVYGGGGIMPDIFVPLDTSGYSDYFKSLIRGGHFNTFPLTYVQKNKKSLLKQYPSITEFKEKFICDETFMKEFFAFVEKEQPDLKYDEEGYKESEYLMKIRLKSIIAQDLWTFSEFYQIYSETNEILQEAIRVLQSGEYNNYSLDK